MENKHYVPKIEEFHIGFEYETMYLQDYDTWKKEILEENDIEYFYSSYFGDAVPSEFRVKYLDDEDVISLGFNQITHDCFNLDVPLYRGREKQEVRLIIRQTVLIYLAQDEKYNDTDTTNLFTGTIKNKSELKRLLKQLQIL
jgi:hypothetical protein